MPSVGPLHSGFPLPPQQYISTADGEEEAGTSWNLGIAVPITRTLSSRHPSTFQFFSRISCYYLCFSGWMNQHNFIKLAICYVSCTPWKAILETNDCKAPHNSRVNPPCCRQLCWGQRHQHWHQEGRDDRAVVTHSICPLRNHLNPGHASARKCPFT